MSETFKRNAVAMMQVNPNRIGQSQQIRHGECFGGRVTDGRHRESRTL